MPLLHHRPLVLAGSLIHMTTFLGILLFGFVAGLAFAPAKELADKIKTAAQVALCSVALCAVGWLFFVRVLADN